MQYYTTDFGYRDPGTYKGFLFSQPRKREARVIFYENVNQEFTSEHEDSAIERLNLLLELLCKASKKNEDTHTRKKNQTRNIFLLIWFSLQIIQVQLTFISRPKNSVSTLIRRHSFSKGTRWISELKKKHIWKSSFSPIYYDLLSGKCNRYVEYSKIHFGSTLLRIIDDSRF